MILYMRLLAEPSAITTSSAAVSAVRLGLNRVLLPLPPCRFRTLPYCFQVLVVSKLVVCGRPFDPPPPSVPQRARTVVLPPVVPVSAALALATSPSLVAGLRSAAGGIG